MSTENKIRSSSYINKNYDDLRKSKKEGKFTLSTIIYKRLKGENRKKRYEKITNEIKKIEVNSKKELLKLSTQIANLDSRLNEEKAKEEDSEEFKIKFQEKMLNLQSKKLTMLELEKDKKYNFYDVIQRLKIPPEQRSIRDVIRIKNYLTQSKLGSNIIKEFPDKNIVEKIINFCCIEMQYTFFKKDETIIKIGEKLDSFYSIISGKIKIMKPFEKKQEMTGFEYFRYLMQLKKNNETYIINQCIKNNDQNFVIETNHIDLIPYIYLLNYLEFIHLNNKEAKELDDILNLINLTPLELGLDPNKFNSQNYKHDYLKFIKRRLPNISHILFDQYSFFNDYINKKEVITYEYKKVGIYKTNDFFGDSFIENRGSIDETLIAEEDCDMAALSNKLYSEQIISEKNILLEQKISNLHENHFFQLIKYGKFSKKYFKLFINEIYNKGDKIFKEGDEIKYIYFIQEGIVELSLNKSINEIEFLIDSLIDKQDIINESDKNMTEINLKDLMKDNLTYEEYQLMQQQNNNENNINIPLSNSNEEIDKDYLNKKQNNKLIILKNNEDIGIISYILGKNYFTNCTVVSNNANIYKLEKKYLNLILSHEYECKEKLFERLKSKIDLIKERLLIISNVKIVMKGKKVIKEDNLEDNIDIIKKTKTKSSNIKALVDYEKINNLLEYKSELNSSYTKLNSMPSQIKSKTENNIKLPLLNSFKKMSSKMIQTPKNNDDINNKDENSKEFSKSKIIELMKKGLMYNLNEVRKNRNKIINNRNKKLESAKKWKVEDKFISKIQKDIKEFSKNKFNVSFGKSPKNKINNTNNNIMSYSSTNSDKIYLTQLNILNNTKPFDAIETERKSEKSKENKENSIEKKSIYFPIKLHTLEKIFSYSDKNKRNDDDIKTNYLNFNTELNSSNSKKKKTINHPYKTPLTLIKQEKYKIFERAAMNNRYNIDYLAESIDKMKKLKKIYAEMKQNSSPKYKNKNKDFK